MCRRHRRRSVTVSTAHVRPAVRSAAKNDEARTVTLHARNRLLRFSAKALYGPRSRKSGGVAGDGTKGHVVAEIDRYPRTR